MEANASELICPVCGNNGSVTITGVVEPETLKPSQVPPIVPDLLTLTPRTLAAAEEKIVAVRPSVPGYEIIRELGRGGMGVVYLARQVELKRLVALKMILAGMHADVQMRDRFRREAEAVARLQHPGIVQIHEVGEHDGRPYLALEYVEGPSLARKILGNIVAARTAGGLTESLARAVSYAHQRGIIHRDLKPGNILLAKSDVAHGLKLGQTDTDCFEPKITDFGLAKQLDETGSQTQTGIVMGTPNYMAPEQAMGRPQMIGPAADIYALGAILYELLTGRPPFLADTGIETIRQLLDQEPVPPTRLQPRVPRDLETICLKCLEKDPRKRYDTADELAEDLHRFRVNKPIRARPVSLLERGWKWGRRRPTAAALLGVIILATCVLFAGSLWYNARLLGERNRAEKNFQMAMQAVDEMLTEVGEEQLASEPRMEEKRRALLGKALALYQEFLQQKSDDLRVRMETALAHRRMADVFRMLEQHDEALAAYQHAIVLLSQLHDGSSEKPEYRRQLAYCHNFRGEVLRAAGRHPEAESAYHEAEQFLEQLLAAFPDPIFQQELARTRYNLGILYRETKRLPEAEQELRRAVELLTDLTGQHPEVPANHHHLARAYLNLATVIRSPQRFAEAKKANDHAIQLLQPLSEKFPNKPDYRHELGVVYNNLGNLLADSAQFKAARTVHGKARDHFLSLASDFPKVPAYRQELANSWNSIGNVYAGEDNLGEAMLAWNRAVPLLQALVAERAGVPAYEADLGMVLGNLGWAYDKQNKPSEARAHIEQSIGLLRKALAAKHGHPDYLRTLRNQYQNLADLLIRSHDHAAAAKAARALPLVFPESGTDRYLGACFLARCAVEADNDPALAPRSRESSSREYADLSIALLRESVRHGFHDLRRIEQDRDKLFGRVSHRPEFRELVEQLAAKAHPSLP